MRQENEKPGRSRKRKGQPNDSEATGGTPERRKGRKPHPSVWSDSAFVGGIVGTVALVVIGLIVVNRNLNAKAAAAAGPKPESRPAVTAGGAVAREELVPRARELERQINATSDPRKVEKLNWELMRIKRSMTSQQLDEFNKE